MKPFSLAVHKFVTPLAFSVHFYPVTQAAFAEHEREQISTRTKDALGAAKRRGASKYGKEVLSQQNATAAVASAESLRSIIERLQAAGFTTVRAIRDELNRQQIPTYRVNGRRHILNGHAILKRLT